MRNWCQRSVPDGSPLPGLHPVLDRVYRSRGIVEPEQLDLGMARLLPVSSLIGVPAAAQLLADAIAKGRRIVLVGDFDVDGATSVALALRALRAFGAVEPTYLVPNRFAQGYGLSPPLVDQARQMQADVLVTVDNGISSHAGVDAARTAGMQVVITDHHLPAERLPAADVLVNPNLPHSGFPSKALAGVGVIFYVMAALEQTLKAGGRCPAPGSSSSVVAPLLDLVALGTVADVVMLDRNNRILVEQGLRRIRAGRATPGLLALLAVAGRNHREAVAADLGFAAGPRLNAAGRLDDMSVGIECLLAEDPVTASALAEQLDGLNRQRRSIESDMLRQGIETVEARLSAGSDALPACLCLHEDGFHEGVVGLLASRLRERFERPTFVFATAEDGSLKGSGRSVPGLHLRDLLVAIDRLEPGLIQRFGGHAAAAGLSLEGSGYPRFAALADASVREVQPADGLPGSEAWTDGPLQASDCGLTLAEELERAGPWGQGMPEPLFRNRFEVVERRPVGDGHLRMQLQLSDASGRVRVAAIAFGARDRDWMHGPDRVDLVYQLTVNRWQGRKQAQLLVRDLAPCD